MPGVDPPLLFYVQSLDGRLLDAFTEDELSTWTGESCKGKTWHEAALWASIAAAGYRRQLIVRGPGGEQLTLPEAYWPALAASSGSPATPIALGALSRREANLLLDLWEHPLGAYSRPFGYQAWGMAVDGDVVAVVVSGSTVSGTVHEDLHRRNVVELARIARHPDHPRALRAMLRLWTDYLARRWPYWRVEAAVSYALPGKAGNLYRFDGWTNVGKRKPSGGGGTWSGRPVPAQIADGRKTLFVYRYA